MDDEQVMAELEDFRVALEEWSEKRSVDARSRILRKKRSIKHIVALAGCAKSLTISPPPAVGGLIMHNVDPIETMFDPPYNMNMVGVVRDIIERTIGAVDAGVLNKMPRNEPEIRADIEKSYAFIAMAIDPADKALADVLDAIKDAAQKCGIHAERVDEQQDSARITDRILESIKRAEFVICDLTGNKPNVFYEAGFALGLGKLPIYVARQGTAVQFDVKDYPIIFFDNMRELREGLMKRLGAISASPAS